MECGANLWWQRLAGCCNSLRRDVCSPGELVPGSQDPGSGGLHKLLGGEVWIVTCACLSISCPSLESMLIATAHAHPGAHLGGALNPLSSCTPKQWSLASWAGPDFSPDSLPASCGALAPSGCVHAANPSPLPGI